MPEWLKVWWNEFGTPFDSYLCAVRQREDVIGIAPLLVEGEKAMLMGDTDVCDYLDFIVAPGKGAQFFRVLLEHLSREGITHLDLKLVHPESTVFTELQDIAQKQGCNVSRNTLDISSELELPATWDEYLLMLTGKQRHEIRRKIKRLHKEARIKYRVVESVEEVSDEIDTFFALFKSSGEVKADFLTDRMVSYFRSLAEAMAEAKMLKLYFLDVDNTTAAASMCFDYNSRIYLYNSGYEPRLGSLSVGLLCKVFSIQDSIQNGRQKYDFLKGAESYKHRLGGREVPLHRCQIQLPN